jgi:hypothetical protein
MGYNNTSDWLSSQNKARNVGMFVVINLLYKQLFSLLYNFDYRYGFRTNPRLWLCAKPQVGERAISVTHITDWIEKKLALEFQVHKFVVDILTGY